MHLRRFVLHVLTLTLACSAILGGSRALAASQVTLPWEGHASGQVREFHLTIDRMDWELAPGKLVTAYAYNGQVPGPELRVTEGDTVRVSVDNRLDTPTTVHWHGLELPVGMDGTPGLSQAPIAPGGSFTYEFVAYPAGTHWYHSHFDELTQHGGGLAGALIVEPRQPAGPPVDREYMLLSGEWATADPLLSQHSLHNMEGHAGMEHMAMGDDGMSPEAMLHAVAMRPATDTFSVNGKAYPGSAPLLVNPGERVRLRLINAGLAETETFALAGHALSIVGTDGYRLPQPVAAEAVRLGSGERADVEFVADHPGRWLLRSFTPGQAERGLQVDVVYPGHEADAVQGFAAGTKPAAPAYASYGGPARADSPPDRTYVLALQQGQGGNGMSWTINGATYPNTDPILAHPGERVRLVLVNQSYEDHPIHLHGHQFQVVQIGDQEVDGPLKDTLTVRRGEMMAVEFVANNPGTWLLHCHNVLHMSGGMTTEVRYQ
jgi:FtsP/CotA-like multicopper oxidase with cupredoxin domain